MESSGLTDKQASLNQKKYGLNLLAEKSKWYLVKELFDSFFSPLVFMLLFASFIALFLGDRIDFFIIFSIIVASGTVTFFQHNKAEHAAEVLRKKVLLEATVIRNGIKKEIPFSEVTINDLVVITVGDIIPADLELLEAKELSVNESTLTGESYPAKKQLNKEKHLSLAFAGTQVVTGEGLGKVVGVGKKTKIGLLSETIVKEKPSTAFDRGINSFSMLLIRIILILSIFIFGINILLHHDPLLSLLFTVALAVGLTPELMPLVITVSLSNGAIKMDKKNVIVKYLPSIQNLGSMNILCTDKTGTLTENAITLASYENVKGEKDEKLLAYAKANAHFQSGYKNPIDLALLDFSKSVDVEHFTKIDEIPFDFERKKVSAVVSDNKKTILITKGAPQNVLEVCKTYGYEKHTLNNEKKKEFVKRIEKLNSDGQRVVALAIKEISKKDAYSPDDERDLTYVGFLVFSDPVKAGVRETIARLRRLGIEIKILTGDNAIVTQKVCEEAGIPSENLLTGETIAKLSHEELRMKAKNTYIFSHLTPEQKAQIIRALREEKYVVGYLGDGINDAPPLKASDVGMSVNNGSDIAKEVADVILMKKSLAVLAEGVIEGRKTYANSFKYIMMSLSSNFGNMMTVAIASIFLPFLPLLPVQILLINFLYDVSQITVPTDNVDAHLIQKPREWNTDFLKRFIILFGPLSSFFDILTFIILLVILHASVGVFRTGWFIESFITETLIIFAIRTQIVPFFKSIPSKSLVTSSVITLIAGIIFVFSPLGKIFSFTGLPIVFFVFTGVELLLYLVCVEAGKVWFYKRYNL